MVTQDQLQVKRGIWKVHRSKTNVLPLCHATNGRYTTTRLQGQQSLIGPFLKHLATSLCTVWYCIMMCVCVCLSTEAVLWRWWFMGLWDVWLVSQAESYGRKTLNCPMFSHTRSYSRAWRDVRLKLVVRRRTTYRVSDAESYSQNSTY